ncbi:poly(U)-specific endoribonuclease-B-like isoform X2 [Acropora millepora]|uniref:poly(U)-specific endoribonuclease-B-like isoform X2 n=1 Tax=Acropora millepora TaxID=45264 RepID=UPI001CF5E2F9|nr:poly(U)-specific endoribonuclease-B-like isoform X2 [Acropora millepora]
MATSCLLLFTLAFFPTTRAGHLGGTVCQDMWNKAVNTLNIPSELEVASTGSTAPLFHVKGTGTGKIHQPVFVKIKELLDTYFGTGDTNTKATEFIDTITVPGTAIEIAFKYLQRVGIVDNTKTLDQFKPILRKPWFDEYKKPGPGKKHSGFEHVFVGDLEGTQFKGFHNWYQFLLEQNASKISNVNDPTFKGSTQPAFMSGLRFKWRGATKRAASSLFVGTSPAFDLALFTVCFMQFKGDTCSCNIGTSTITVQTYAASGHSDLIATAYPAIVTKSSKPQASQVRYLNNDEPSRQKYHKCYGIPPSKRQDCGYVGIKRPECENKNDCCFDDSTPGVPVCYKGNP